MIALGPKSQIGLAEHLIIRNESEHKKILPIKKPHYILERYHMKLVREDKTNILLVGNYSETRPELETTLNQPDYYLVKVDSCIEGCRELFERNFALILISILSEMDKALGLIKRLAKFHDIPVVFV